RRTASAGSRTGSATGACSARRRSSWARRRSPRSYRPLAWSAGRGQLADRRAALLEERDRPAVGAGDAPALGVDPQVPVEGREEVPDPDPPVRRVLAAAVGRADHLAPGD